MVMLRKATHIRNWYRLIYGHKECGKYKGQGRQSLSHPQTTKDPVSKKLLILMWRNPGVFSAHKWVLKITLVTFILLNLHLRYRVNQMYMENTTKRLEMVGRLRKIWQFLQGSRENMSYLAFLWIQMSQQD